MNKYVYDRHLPVKATYDVLVAGSGPAGICAVVAAARAGVRAAIIERYGVLGGNLTGGHVGPVLGMVCPGTMRDELMHLLGVAENDMIGKTGSVHDFEHAKFILNEFVYHPNIDVLLQTQVFDVIKDGNCVTGLVVCGKEGAYVLNAKVVIDATGDGDVAFFSGAQIEKGREDGLMQPVSHEFLINNVDEGRAIACIGDVDDVQLNDEKFLDFCKRCGDEGILPKNIVAVRLHRTVHPGERNVNTTQVNGIDATRTDHIYYAERQLRNQIRVLIDFFRQHLPGYEHCRLISSPSTLGVRETRRVIGEYVITAEDLVQGKRFDDVIVHKAEFIIDIHNPSGAGQAEGKIQYVQPYDLPYRCFVPRNVDGLMTAGRCISGTHRAHASYRVMSICMAMGEAVGTAAALCAKKGCQPRNLAVNEVQKLLQNKGIDLFSQ